MKNEMRIPAYAGFLSEIKERIRAAQYTALRAVNKEIICLYWDIGKMIVEQQERHGWGKSVVVNLARDLQAEFPGMAGYSSDNLWRMRKFYLHFKDSSKLAPLVQEISWTKIIIIMEGCKDDLELERALITKVNRFLIEMGGAFTFMGNQFRLEIDGIEFFIDILLYHRRLKCLVAIELKVGKFLPEYVGKMQFYLAALDSRVKEKGENSSIGIILCKDKSRTIVEYALRETKKPIAVAKYKITSDLPMKLRKELPAPEQIRKLFNEI